MTMMAENEHVAGLTPPQEQIVEIGANLELLNYSLFGHGTPVNDPEIFYKSGLLVSNGATLKEATVRLDPGNIGIVDDWPHKKYTDRPNVVLLAIPNPDSDQGVDADAVNNYMFELDEKGRMHLPARYILGLYQASTYSLGRNPNFDLRDNSHAEDMVRIGTRRQAVLARPRYVAPAIVEAPVAELHPDSTDQVW